MKRSFRIDEPMEIVKYDDYGCENLMQKDSFGMKKEVERFTKIISGKEGTVAITSQYGGGKSFFLSLLYCELKKKRNCIYIDISKHEHEEEIFIILIKEILQEPSIKSPVKEVAKEFMEIAKDTAGILFPQWNLLIGTGMNIAKRFLNIHEKVISIDVRNQMYEKLNRVTKDMPLVILVDNLDRCRPDYVLKFFAEIKDILKVKGILFVLAYDKREILNVIKRTFGDNVDVESYLKKYVATEYQLDSFSAIVPPDSLKSFIKSAVRPETFFSMTETQNEIIEKITNTIVCLFNCFPTISLRKLELIVKRISVLLDICNEHLSGSLNKEELFAVIILLLFIKNIDSELYSFIRLKSEDQYVLTGLFSPDHEKKLETELKGLEDRLKNLLEQKFERTEDSVSEGIEMERNNYLSELLSALNTGILSKNDLLGEAFKLIELNPDKAGEIK